MPAFCHTLWQKKKKNGNRVVTQEVHIAIVGGRDLLLGFCSNSLFKSFYHGLFHHSVRNRLWILIRGESKTVSTLLLAVLGPPTELSYKMNSAGSQRDQSNLILSTRKIRIKHRSPSGCSTAAVRTSNSIWVCICRSRTTRGHPCTGTEFNRLALDCSCLRGCLKSPGTKWWQKQAKYESV